MNEILIPEKILNELSFLYNSKKLNDLKLRLETLLSVYPNSSLLWNIEGAVKKSLQLFDEAEFAFKKVVEINPKNHEGFNNLGIILKEKNNFNEAILNFKKAININKKFTEAFNNLGTTFHEIGKFQNAIENFKKAIASNEHYYLSHFNLGNTLLELNKLKDAEASYKNSININPEFFQANYNLGNVYEKIGEIELAIHRYEEAFKQKPSSSRSFAKIIYLKKRICDWDIDYTKQEKLINLGIVGERINPLLTLSFEDNPERQMLRSIKYASEIFLAKDQKFFPKTPIKQKIKVGYFSSDFHDHAVLNALIGLLQSHDRSKFEICAYHYNKFKRDNLTKKLKKNVDLYFDISHLTNLKAVELIESHSLNIAIDLNGFTKNSRSEIFSFRLAPIQLNFLGFPGTMGTDCIDYLIADKIVIPKQQRKFYKEKILFLPNCFLPNDNKRILPILTTTRSDYNLPEDAFVFCCFNNSYKISLDEFSIWMKLLKQKEKSVLWLSKSNKWVQSNLKKEAKKMNVDPKRLIFAEKVSSIKEHLIRHNHADIYLDTFNYNGHTSVSDALWSGLPVVTKIGKQFSSRVASSLLTSIGLDELITTNKKDYESLILELVLNPGKLSLLKIKLKENILNHPLFNNKLYASNFEKGLKIIYQNFLENKKPQDIDFNSS